MLFEEREVFIMDREFLLEHGFAAVKKDNLFEVVQIGKVKEVSIDISANNPSMLLGRTKENQAVIKAEDKRLIVFRADKNKTYLLNVPVAAMDNICFKVYENGANELIFELVERQIMVQIVYTMGE